MPDLFVVDAPMFWPSKCVQCNSQTGPLVDTGVEVPMYGHIYQCQSCIRLNALEVGLLRGKRYDELVQIAKDDAARALELEQTRARITELEDEKQLAAAAAEELTERLGTALGRVNQLERLIGDDARMRLALVSK